MDPDTRTELDRLMRLHGLYDRARDALRQFVASPAGGARDPFDVLQEAGIVDELLSAMRASNIDASLLSALVGGAQPFAPQAEPAGAPAEAPPPSSAPRSPSDSLFLHQSPERPTVPGRPDSVAEAAVGGGSLRHTTSSLPGSQRRTLRVRFQGGRAFLAHIDAGVGDDDASAATASRTRRQYSLHALCCGQRFRSDPVPVAVDPPFNEEFVVDLTSAIEAGLVSPPFHSASTPAPSPPLPASHMSPLLSLMRCDVGTGGLHLLLTMDTLVSAAPSDPGGSGHGSGPADRGDGAAGGSSYTSPPPESVCVSRELVASQTLDWRLLLCEEGGVMHTVVRLAPAGAAAAPSFSAAASDAAIPVGILPVQLTLEPAPGEGGALVRADVRHEVAAQATLLAERSRALFEASKAWWSEYKAVDASFRRRGGVRMYAPNERLEFHAAPMFVSPLIADRAIDSPFHAARFVALLPFRQQEPVLGGEPVRREVWHSPHAILALRQGDVEDHATLLCSLFLGLGLDAYVAIGTRDTSDGAGEADYAWVVTREERQRGEGNSGSLTATFWDPLTGTRSASIPDIPEAGAPRYARLHCLFNNVRYYANHQLDDRVTAARWDLNDLAAWKVMDSPLLLSLPHVPLVAISPPRLDPTTLAIAIEGALKARIISYRASFLHQQLEPGTDAGTLSPHTPPSSASLEAAARGHKLPAPPSSSETSTAWDDRLAFITTQALVSFETERLTGTTVGGSEFEAAVRRAVPRGWGFQGFPVQFNHVSPARMMATLLAAPVARGILQTRAEGAAFAVRCRVFAYAEDVVAVWVMLAVRHRFSHFPQPGPP